MNYPAYLVSVVVATGVVMPTYAKTIEEIEVTADFRAATVKEIPASISVVDASTIQQRNAQHFEDLLNGIVNVNYSAGASRGRFVQIRGVGERSQFRDPLDPSVGLIVDGMDFSGIGLAGALLDVQQVEVLRGPQGTRYGSNAMAGMLNIRSNDPAQEFTGKVSAGFGNYDSFNVKGVVSGPLSENLLGRFAVSHLQSDGYIENSFLGTDDTNNFDEIALRAKLKWLASDDLSIDLAATYLDVDNGYDAFSLANTRTTGSDMPGHDRQETLALSISSSWEGHDAYRVETLLSFEQSDLEYGFDWDWSNWNVMDEFRDAGAYQGGENNARDRTSFSGDIRLLSAQPSRFLANADWVIGAYYYDREVDLDYSDTYEEGFGPVFTSTFTSTYESERAALYGQLDWDLGNDLSLGLGGRWERYDNEYIDSVGIAAKPGEDLWGLKASLEYLVNDSVSLYGVIGRGFKTGGVNGQTAAEVAMNPDLDPAIADFLTARTTFQSETLINYELGVKGINANHNLSYTLAVFYMDRKDMQANAWVLFPPAEWRSYLDNVDDGSNYGIEFEADWQLSDQLSLSVGLGLLETELGNLVVQDVDSGNALDQRGREQAHAPGYQFNLGATYRFTPNLYANVQVEGKDDYFFSNSHNISSDAFELLHLNIGYARDSYEFTLWARNLTDEDYQVRGFYFANNPMTWATQPYYQYGEPRVAGVTGAYNF